MDSAEQQPNNAPALLEKSDSGRKSMRSPKHLLRVVFQPLGAIVASPQRQSSAGSPLSRQRSYSYDSPARPIRESDLVTSNLGAAQVLVDGSPLKTSSFYRKLDQSNRKVALVTQRAYCIISDKPMHALFFQVGYVISFHTLLSFLIFFPFCFVTLFPCDVLKILSPEFY